MQVLRQFHNIVSDQNITFEQKVQGLLSFGLDLFGLDIGLVSRVDNESYIVIHAKSPGDIIAPGTSFVLGDTYCSHTLRANKAIGFHHAGKSSICTHPCYLNLKLESYIGAPMFEGNRVIGTVNFSASAPRGPFTLEEIDYIELFAQWLGMEISQQRVLNKLENSHLTLRKLENVGKIGTWEVNLQTDELIWSEQTLAIHEVESDYQPNLDQAKDFYLQGDSRESVISAVNNAIETGNGWDLELQMITAKANQIWVSAKGEAEFENGNCVRLFGTLQDITESIALNEVLREQKEVAELALKQRSELIAKISHELRTPLNGIVGMLNTLENEQDNKRREEKVKIAKLSANTLMNLIDEVLDYSKINQGELTLVPEHTQLNKLISDTVSMYIPLCEQKNLDLQTCIDISDKVWAYVDVTRIRQILSNLLSNSVKFTDTGSVRINATAKGCNSHLDLHFQVIDTGIGMSNETMNELFTPFRQGAKHITRKYGGTGLGLSIVKELLDLMKGKVEVSSDIGKGTQFDVYLTLPKGQEQIDIGEEKPLPDASNLEILVVDDNEINRVVMGELLKQFKASAEVAVDGYDAIEKCKVKQYDIIFMDCVMPELDGILATKKLFQENLIDSNTLVVALTANTSDEDKANCFAAGMNMFIAKPVQIEALRAALDSVLEPSS